MTANWNPWHGCHKLSPGCKNCYVYRTDSKHGKDSSIVTKTSTFKLPVSKKRDGGYKIEPGTFVWTCFTSDFLIEDADEWREEAWQMMKERNDLNFLFITKRIDRFHKCIPPDWGDGYENVHICCTVENQEMADYRLPIFREAPIRKKTIVCEPLIGPIDLSAHLGSWVIEVNAGGESGNEARPCNFDWILGITKNCVDKNVAFHFRQTGARLIKDGRLYRILRKYQHSQARKAKIDFTPV